MFFCLTDYVCLPIFFSLLLNLSIPSSYALSLSPIFPPRPLRYSPLSLPLADFRLTNTKPMTIVDMWKKLHHSNLVSLRNVFTAKSGFKSGENSLVYVYDFYPGAETLLSRHFSGGAAIVNPMLQVSAAAAAGVGVPRPNGFPASSVAGDPSVPEDSPVGGGNEPRQHAGLLPESLIWTYVVQLSSAIRTIHAAGLAARVLGDPSKIIITGEVH